MCAFLSYLNKIACFYPPPPSFWQLFVFSQSFSPSDDLYIEGRTSGDLPIDDEDGDDGGSGSGSGDYGKDMYAYISIYLCVCVCVIYLYVYFPCIAY